ncbi:hypothetical protein OD91_2213 [Lutibacter sp. Hel_I_33_5]|uniref:hypothetical protein n=1 Tax=Lutibacter sp. Hel_I_33_5 TaxID=1566289 RepID=UPI00119DB744|nr:hypothetical protein [Lutibacter sp. Hel_I_33_5]TVZ56911.1 hypothetical protein OD91_2213 [Lutibacter sp. Hel_I_33_5]
MKKSIHLVSFDVPYPPNYGGIIDVFYKIIELHKKGVSIYLHTYLFNNKRKQTELEKYCEKVFYYKRKNSFLSILSTLPFRVKSRKNNTLIYNLIKIKAPVLFEGLHTCYPLLNKVFDERTFIRTHNIEHDYFYGLAKSESNIFKKIFFFMEGWKLKRFEKHINKVTGIFTISPYEQRYFTSNYGNKCHYIPAFHKTKTIDKYSKKRDFILFHGDLRVSDNIKAALFLIKVYKDSGYKFIIASSKINKKIESEIKKHDAIVFKDIPDQDSLEKLLKEAHINTLFTFQKTGIKLKLLNTLYQGKHIIANSKMIDDTGLENLCVVANSKKEILRATEELFSQDFEIEDIKDRQDKLIHFSPEESAKKMIKEIFKP